MLLVPTLSLEHPTVLEIFLLSLDMAPEIICGKGYNCLVDLWSVGICLYEFMCGMVPFGEEAEDPYEIYEEIIKKDISYPNYLKDKKAKKLMDQLIAI